MDESKELSKRRCEPCHIGGSPLEAARAGELHAQLNSWEMLDCIKLKRVFKFKDFVGSMAFVKKVADISESEGHHPTILISYNKVTITLATHAVGGLSENDFIIASRIDGI